MSGFAFRKTCIKYNVSKVRKGFERWLVVFNKKEKKEGVCWLLKS
jgi:hypothetical protein